MESLKIEIMTATQSQLAQVKNVMEGYHNVNEWQIAPYIDGYLLSIRGINVLGASLIQQLVDMGISAERLYEE